MTDPVIIVGAGISGLICAKHIYQSKHPLLILEASGHVGGRIATDVTGAYSCDRGFQVLVDSYPEAQRYLRYDDLQLGRFAPGALVATVQGLQLLADPRRQPSHIVRTLQARCWRWSDVAALWSWLRSPALPQQTLGEHVQRADFSATFRQSFVLPWLTGIFFDRSLAVRADHGMQIIKQFTSGAAALPGGGMGRIPQQIADDLPADVFRFHATVRKVTERAVELSSGEMLAAAAVVVATSPQVAATLLPTYKPSPGLDSLTVHLSAPDPLPWDGRWLLLNGDQSPGAIAYAVPSAVAAGYAPQGRQLISATVMPEDNLADPVGTIFAQLKSWFGDYTRWSEWTCVRIDRIRYAKPLHRPVEGGQAVPEVVSRRLPSGLYHCSDDRTDASFNGACQSGRLAAEAVLAHLGVSV